MRRQPLDQAEQLLHGRTSADHPAELGALGCLLFRLEQPAAPDGVLTHGREEFAEALEIERLGEVVDGAQLDGLDRALDRGRAGHEDHVTVGIRLANRAQHVESADVGHAQVDGGDVRVMFAQVIEGRSAARASHHVESHAFSDVAQHVQDRLLIVDDEQRGRRGATRCASAMRSRHQHLPGTHAPDVSGARLKVSQHCTVASHGVRSRTAHTPSCQPLHLNRNVSSLVTTT